MKNEMSPQENLSTTDIVDWAVNERGMKPGEAASRQEELADIDRAMVVDPLSDKDIDLLRASGALSRGRGNKRRMPLRNKVAIGLTAATVAAGIANHVTDKESETGPEPAVAEYVVQPGDTAWGIAEQLDAADGVVGNEDIRPQVDDIMEQATQDGNPGLQPGEVIELPADKDRHMDEGFQLSPK
jgi:hypothetical protein